MAFYFYILLLLNGLTGTCSVTTVSKVSVNDGQSLSIPCHYEPQYRNHVKYLCEGYYFSSCSFVIKSNEPKKLQFSISDDKDQRIFTVTMRKLNVKKLYFWCAVEKSGSDVRHYFELSFTTGTPILSVNDQEITGFVGENVNIEFHQRTPGNVKCCRLAGACVLNRSGFIDGTRLIINKTNHKGFIVTMSELKTKSSGWYLCETGDYQMPVHLTVKEKPITTATATTVETAVTSHENGRVSTSFDLKSLIIPLSVLIAIIIMTLIVWILLGRKQTKADVPATTRVEEVTDYDVKRKSKRSHQAEDEVTYSSVVHMKQNPSQRSHDEQKADVLYSSVVARKKPNAEISSLATTDDNVVYSSIVAVNKNTTKKTGKEVEEITYSTVAGHS